MRKSLLGLLLLAAVPAHSQDGEVRLLTDDAIPRYLSRGQELARAEQWEKVVDVLHRVVIGDKEVFPDLKPEVLHSAVYSADGRVFYPARELCLKELARLPPAGLRAYRDAFDREARAIFDRAAQAVGIQAKLEIYTEVFDKYLASTVGDDALEAAGDLHLAVGRFYEALAMFRRLVDLYPKDTDRDVAMILTKAAFCSAQIGDHEHRNVLLERLASEHPGKRLRIEGELVATEDLKTHRLLAVRGGGVGATFAPDDWPVAGGSPSRSRLSADLPDDLPRQPFWSFRIAEREPKLRAMYGDWVVYMHDRAPSARPRIDHLAGEFVTPYPTVRPVIHDGMVFYKDYLEIVGRHIGSGSLAPPRARYHVPDTFTDPQYLYPISEVRPRPNDSAAAKLEAAYRYLDYGGNSLVVGGGMILTLECRAPPMNLTGPSRAVASPPNTIVAYDRNSAKMVWSWHKDYCSVAVSSDPALYKRWRADFEAHPTPVFQGPGVIHGRLLYTLVAEREEMAGMSLWAFDIHTGMVRYRTPLHYPDEINGLLPRGASLAVAGGIVYVISHSGVVAAVDALPPGRVRWITRYRRNLSRATGGRRGRNRRGAQLVKQGFAYNEPLVAGGKVFIAPADSKEIVALDAETGVIAWTASKQALGRIYQLLGVVDGVLVVAGDKVLGIDAAKGEKAWGPVDLDGWSHGRGVLSETYAYLPTHHDGARRSLIERIDLRTGVKATSLEFDVEKLGNLLVSDGRLIAANGDQIMCFTTRERELARIDKKLAGAARKRDFLHERAMVQLTGGTPDRVAAQADFDRALATTAAEGEHLLLRANALENLFVIAMAGNDLETLAKARALVAPLAAMKNPADESNQQRAYLAQIALLEAQILGKLGRGEESLTAIEKFLDEHGHGRVVMANRVVEAAAAAKELRAYLLANNEGFRRAFAEGVRARIRAATERGDKAALAAMPARYGHLAPSEEASFALCDLNERDQEWGRAEIVLRRFIEGFPKHERRGYAHLRLARLLSRAGLVGEARRERDQGLSRLDEAGRETHGKLIEELDKLLPSDRKPGVAPEVGIPLTGEEVARNGTPVPIGGKAPAGVTLFADVGGYTAYDATGKVAWRQPFPAGAVSPGPSGDSATMVVAAAIARARLAEAVGTDLVLADIGGVLRVEAATGKVRWRYPAATEHAAAEAQRALSLLRADLQRLKAAGSALREHPLPGYVIAGDKLIRAAPRKGVEALNLESGASQWVDGPIAATPIAAPTVLGQLVAVGWTKPGRVRVYDIVTGKIVTEHVVGPKDLEGGVLLAPPVLDPLGRLIVVTAPAPDGRGGALQILNARTLAPATDPVPAASATARVLHADGALVVFHDGGSAGAGSQNLHFIDLKARLTVSKRAPTLLRSVDVLRDDQRLFVFSHNPGLEDTGARLFRIDLRSMESLAYGLPPRALAYARPILTRRYIVTLSALPRSAHVRFYDRDASTESRAPQAVFLGAEGREVSELDYRPTRATRYEVPPSVSIHDGRVFIGQPFGVSMLQARDTR